MSFQEKSAWIMSLALSITGLSYLGKVISVSSEANTWVAPSIPSLLSYTIILAVIAIIGHIVIAMFTVKEANEQLDEREHRILERAGYLSGHIFGGGTIIALIQYLINDTENLLFYMVLASLIVAQLCEYLIRIYLCRKAVI